MKKGKPYGRTARELQGDWSGKPPKKAAKPKVPVQRPILGYSRTTTELYGR